MLKSIRMRQFMYALFDDETIANKAAEIGQALLEARSLRLTEAGDVTEIERPQARHTTYVGKLSDGKTQGFWVLVLATHIGGAPFRAI
ncbi:MAG: hypothetical protein QXS54_04795 [Candidatus Methanomethylicaceae archaeon]